MKDTSARKNILDKIAKALTTPSEYPVPEMMDCSFFRNRDIALLARFSSEFTAIDGKLEVCENERSLRKALGRINDENNWKSIYVDKGSVLPALKLEKLPFTSGAGPDEPTAVITGCEFLVARTGTIVLSSAQDYGRSLTVYAPVHIIVASSDQLVYDTEDAMNGMITKYRDGLPSALFFASGPSRTGDIEKTLVKGVHGPTQVYLFLLTGEEQSANTLQPDYQTNSQSK